MATSCNCGQNTSQVVDQSMEDFIRAKQNAEDQAD